MNNEQLNQNITEGSNSELNTSEYCEKSLPSVITSDSRTNIIKEGMQKIFINFDIIKEKIKQAFQKSKLVDNVIGIYASRGKHLSDSQIFHYQQFARAREDANVKFNLWFKNNKNIHIAGYLLKDNSNYELYSQKIISLTAAQTDIINTCDNLIEKSNLMLENL